jgi:hypothetical protein
MKHDTDAETGPYVDEKTLNTWKIAHPEFLQSLEARKGEADAMMPKSFYLRAPMVRPIASRGSLNLPSTVARADRAQ